MGAFSLIVVINLLNRCEMGKKILIGLVVSGLVILTVGLTILFGYPSFYNKQSSLVRGSQTYEEWVQPDLPVYMRYHMYNCTNADQFINGHHPRPTVEEVGVLSYREYEEKLNVEYSDSARVVSYVSNKTYIFDPSTSTMNETDIVTVPNILMFTILATAPPLEREVVELKLNEWALDILNPDLQNAVSPYYKVEAGDFLWGYYNNSLLVQLAKLVGGPTTFGLQSNNSNDGPYKILTGKDNTNERRGGILEWYGYAHYMNFYSDKYSNEINGTDGEVFPVDIDTKKRLYVFDSDVCRSLFLVPDTDDPQNEIDGASTTKFTAPPELFQTDFEDNVAFCKGGRVENCVDGLMDVSQCYQFMFDKQLGLELTISIIMSGPQYLYADNATINQIDGFSPNKTIHETYVTLNTETGVMLQAAKRLQVNTKLKKYSLNSLRHLGHDWNYTVPLFWAEETLEVDSGLVHLVKEANRLSLSARVIALLLIAVGVMLLLGALIVVMFYESSETELLFWDHSDAERNQSYCQEIVRNYKTLQKLFSFLLEDYFLRIRCCFLFIS